MLKKFINEQVEGLMNDHYFAYKPYYLGQLIISAKEIGNKKIYLRNWMTISQAEAVRDLWWRKIFESIF